MSPGAEVTAWAMAQKSTSKWLHFHPWENWDWEWLLLGKLRLGMAPSGKLGLGIAPSEKTGIGNGPFWLQTFYQNPKLVGIPLLLFSPINSSHPTHLKPNRLEEQTKPHSKFSWDPQPGAALRLVRVQITVDVVVCPLCLLQFLTQLFNLV